MENLLHVAQGDFVEINTEIILKLLCLFLFLISFNNP